MTKSLAILGGAPMFDQQIPIGQYNLPPWEHFESIVSDIFERKYYTNQGPLTKRLESDIQHFLNVKHAICMTNTGIALMIAAKALDLKKKVMVSGFSHVSILQTIRWAGLEPVYCDVDPQSFQVDIDKLKSKLSKEISAILVVNAFGGMSDLVKLQQIAHSHNTKLYFLSSDGFGQQFEQTKLGSFGDLEVFSLHERMIVNGTDGAIVTTNDDFLAARLRNIRSSYGSGPAVPIPFTGNGRMSEMQAGMAIASLQNFEQHKSRNKELFTQYKDGLSELSGIKIVTPAEPMHQLTYQRCIVQVDQHKFGLSAHQLSKALLAEHIQIGVFEHYGLNPDYPFEALPYLPNTSIARQTLIEFPLGSHTTSGIVKNICSLVRMCQSNSGAIVKRLV